MDNGPGIHNYVMISLLLLGILSDVSGYIVLYIFKEKGFKIKCSFFDRTIPPFDIVFKFFIAIYSSTFVFSL